MSKQPSTRASTRRLSPPAPLQIKAEDGSLLPLALRPREAARALGIGERLLWSLTNRGEIPYLKLGKATLYPIADLQQWLSEQAEKGLRR